ncbi:hypothetical protein WME73_30985 [Sorangium sp. So ce302]|uniref:monooxygenase n=1 Tax=unclassified Sorangium TaxID=2621164 RepID=UPI003F60D130
MEDGMKFYSIAMLTLFALLGGAGCGGEDVSGRDVPTPSPVGGNEPTYYEDIAPLVNRECAGCHRVGGIGRFSLSDPTVAQQMAGAAAAATEARRMPPMPVSNDGTCNTYKNAHWLSDEEIDLFRRWSAAGAPLGDRAAAPPPEDNTLKLTGELAQLDIGVDYTPQPHPGELDDYHCFMVDPGIHADTFITGYDIQPGESRVVHHVALFELADGEAEAEAAALDAAEAGPGYTCFGGVGVDRVELLAIWVPGAGANAFPEGTGIRYAAGRKLVVQMHYNVPPGGGPFVDRSKIQLQLSGDAALTTGFYIDIAAEDISLPPGQQLVEVKRELALSAMHPSFADPAFKGLRIWGALPHMHYIGQTQRTVAKVDGVDVCFTDVDRWNFHWQNLWWYEAPLELKGADILSITCGFDTRSRTETTKYGEGSNDEMCFNLLYATIR